MFRDPVRDPLAILVHEIVLKVADLAFDYYMLVYLPVFTTAFAQSEQAKYPDGVIAAPYPTTHPDESALDVEAVLLGEAVITWRISFLSSLGTHSSASRKKIHSLRIGNCSSAKLRCLA